MKWRTGRLLNFVGGTKPPSHRKATKIGFAARGQNGLLVQQLLQDVEFGVPFLRLVRRGPGEVVLQSVGGQELAGAVSPPLLEGREKGAR